MNLYRFLLHSSWVAIAITIFSPSSARSAEVSKLSTPQEHGGVEANQSEQSGIFQRTRLHRASGSAADLRVKPRGVYFGSNRPTANHTSNQLDSSVVEVSQVQESGDRSLEFVRPDTENENLPQRNIHQFIRSDEIPTKPPVETKTPENWNSPDVEPPPPQPDYPPQMPEATPVKNPLPVDENQSVEPVKLQQDFLELPTNPEQIKLQELKSLTLEEALEIAQQNNPEFQAALIKVKRGRAVLREARSELYPQINLNGRLNNSQSASDELGVEKGVLLPQSDEAATRFSGQAEVRYNIFSSGRRGAKIREAEERLRIDKLDVEEKYQTLRLNTTLRYYDLQSADEQVRIGESAVKNAKASLQDAQARERAGVGTKFDVLRSQVNLANAQQDLTNALSQQQIARRSLATQLSLPGQVNIATGEPVKIAGLWEASLEESTITAYNQRSELQQRLAERNIGKQQRRQALAAKGPQVDFVANYEILDQLDDDAGLADGYSIGVEASLNLFDGGAAKARANQAKADIAIAETNFASQRDQIRFQVEQFYSQLRSNQENVQTATLALEQATEALRLARLRFQAGVGTQTDVIAAENDLTRAEGNRITAILDYNRALANLERAVATPSEEKS